MSIKVLIADDHEVVRRGLQTLLKDTDIKFVGEAANGDQAVEQTAKHKPDVVLLDIRMPGTDGLGAMEMIKKKSPNTKIVVLSTYDNPTYIARSVSLGASDYVLKGSARKDIVQAITRAAKGDIPSDSSVMRSVKMTMAKRKEVGDETVPLTNREIQVLRHVALGLSNREIGRALGISVETVKEHVQNLLRKIQCSDRTQAAVWAVRNNLV